MPLWCRIGACALGLLLLAGTPIGGAAGPTPLPPVPEPARARELLMLLHRDCGACHGMRLTGGLGPALTPQALRDKPVDSLVATVVGGRAGTPMPPWGRFMSDAEAQWLVARLVAGDADAH